MSSERPFYEGKPTQADLWRINEEATTARRRFQDWTSTAAIAAIALSVGLIDNPGLDRNIFGAGLLVLVATVAIAVFDRIAELQLLLRGLKYGQRALEGVQQEPLSRFVWLRKARFWAFYIHSVTLLLGLTLLVVATLGASPASAP